MYPGCLFPCDKSSLYAYALIEAKMIATCVRLNLGYKYRPVSMFGFPAGHQAQPPSRSACLTLETKHITGHFFLYNID